jgi:hypothetical protein
MKIKEYQILHHENGITVARPISGWARLDNPFWYLWEVIVQFARMVKPAVYK